MEPGLRDRENDIILSRLNEIHSSRNGARPERPGKPSGRNSPVISPVAAMEPGLRDRENAEQKYVFRRAV